MLLPAWLALTPQFPVLRKVTTLPEMLQFPFGTGVNVTASPELAVALSVRVLPTVCAGMELKVMVWDWRAAFTVKLWVTEAAAA